MGTLHEYRVTFGQKYHAEPHPTFSEAHPDGWLTIMATDMDTARDTAVDGLGTAWSNLSLAADYGDWERCFPLGELHRIEVIP